VIFQHLTRFVALNRGYQFSQQFNAFLIVFISLSVVNLNDALAEEVTAVNTLPQTENSLADPATLKELNADITADNLDGIYREMATNSRWENIRPANDFNEAPYQLSIFSNKNGEDKERLWSQTKSIFGYGFGIIGLIALLPEDVSNWDSEEGVFNKWTDNVKAGPVWDRDTMALNFIGHPFFGGAYYQIARKSGYRQWDAFVYSAIMSTFYWEYGVEAFAETPSIQDLVITPVLGWAYGEWAFNTEMQIRKGGNTVLGSSMLGSTALFFLDPVDYMSAGLNNMFGRELIRSGTGYVGLKEVPYGNAGKTDSQVNFNISLEIGDGSNYSSSRRMTSARQRDPVDRGIIGISYGVGNVELDDSWNVEGGSTTEVSLGLYFNRKFSSRLTYSKANLFNNVSQTKNNYENYSIDSQYYFNSKNNFRPYLTAGFGETLWRKEIESKRFQINAGVGAHYQLNNNIAVQLDWRYYHSANANTEDQNTSLRLIYRLGEGER
jgi:opacity protein-like surface antigen